MREMDPRLWWALAIAALTVLFVLRRQLMKPYRSAAEWVRARPPLGLVLAIALSVLAAVLLAWKVPIWQLASRRASLTAKEYLELENSYRATIVQALGGLVLLIGIYLTWRRVAATEQQVEVAREEQITERFTRAIEQLGSEKLEVCLGGIYALERIARDSERDHWPIMEVLTAYVRENAPRTEPPPSASIAVGADIQAILTVIARREWRRELSGGMHLDLSNTDLSGSKMEGAFLREADLASCRLDNSCLNGCLLEYANLRKASLVGCQLRQVWATEAIFHEASLRESDLSASNLAEADLSVTDLAKAHLYKAKLRGAMLTDSNLKGATLGRAYLAGCAFAGSVLDDAHLFEADLSGASFSVVYENISPDERFAASMRGTNLKEAILKDASMEGVDLSQTEGLSRAQIDSAITSENTKLPNYLKERGEGEPEALADGGELEEEKGGEED